jgi:hypothetical protein
VDALGFGGGSEQASDVREAVLFGFLGESPVLLVSLALSSKRFFEVVGCIHGVSLSELAA